MEKIKNDPLLKDVAVFSAKNSWDPLFGLDEGAAYKTWRYLSQNATVLESMLVALNHMQVNVCYFRGCSGRGQGLSGFRKNIIAFPQDIADLKNLRHFWSKLAVNDIVNVRQPLDHGALGPLLRARVVQLESSGIRVACESVPSTFVVPLESVEQRIVLPWKPRALADYFIVFRRKDGHKEEYVEDLRVRRNLIRQILDFLMELGFWRPDQGEQCRHLYYSTCDRCTDHQMEEFLPEDGVPSDLNFQTLNETMLETSLDKLLFIE